MKILNRLTIKNLKLNKKRTMVTIIGIILATTLITSITTLVSSFRKSMIEYQKLIQGNYHYQYINLQKDDLKNLENNTNIEKTFITQNVGYIKLENAYIFTKPYASIIEFSKEALENLNIQLFEGRFPQNSNEILIEKEMNIMGKLDWKIGDEVELNISKTQNDSSKTNDLIKTYKIVGTIAKPIDNIETVQSQNYTIISYLDNIQNENINVFVRYKNLINNKEINQYEYKENNTLVSLESGKIEGDMSFAYLIAIIFIAIIIVTSVYCIRNSFEISITERIQQYGILSSVGATSKQLSYNVFFESFILGLIAIPIGIIFGISLIFILISMVKQFFGSNLFGTDFLFDINVMSIVITIFFDSLTIYLVARKTAQKAAKITIIEAIRSNQDIKINAKKMKYPHFIKSIFGIGGEIAYKNLKRNNKKYRTTIISIIVSIMLFVSISSFTQYAFKSLDSYKLNYNVSVQAQGSKNYELLQEIAKHPTVNSYSIIRISNDLDISETISTFPSGYPLYTLGEQEYQKFITTLGLSYEDAKDKLIWLTYKDKNTLCYKHFGDLKYEKGDIIRGKINNQIVDLEVVASTRDIRPLGLGDGADYGAVISEEFWNKYKLHIEDYDYLNMLIDSNNADELTEFILNNYSTTELSTYNEENSDQTQKAVCTMVSIFLYLLIIIISLVGLTNIFNTITINMNLRQKEFAILKSIGMTKKEFNKMISLESTFYGIKSLAIGLPLGIMASYLIYKVLNTSLQTSYIFPTMSVIISIIVVFILLKGIMKYSLSKINKQNIIETIRNDNI